MEENPDDDAPEKVEGKEEPKGPPPVPETGEPGGEAGVHEVIWANAKLFSGRIVRSNFLSDGISEEEKEALEKEGVTSPMSQNYLAWRRAMLWFGGVALGITVIFGMFSHFEGFESSPGVIQMVLVLLFLANIGACFLGILAALKWTDIPKTRQMARFSWICIFVVPILLFMIPVTPFMGQQDFQGQNPLLFSISFGAIYFLFLAPKLVGLFPALIRSSLTLKTLLPESPMPGWIAVVIAPLYALFFVILLVIAMQIGNFLLIVSLAAFAAAPVFIALSVNRLVQPCSEEQAISNIRHVRKRIGIANMVGVVSGIIYGFQLLQDVSFFRIFLFVASLVAAVFLLTVVAADLLIGVFKTAFFRENVLREGELAGSLKERFVDLESRGLTELSAGEDVLLNLFRGGDKSGESEPPKDPPVSPPPTA